MCVVEQSGLVVVSQNETVDSKVERKLQTVSYHSYIVHYLNNAYMCHNLLFGENTACTETLRSLPIKKLHI